jgi:hypothetical protein
MKLKILFILLLTAQFLMAKVTLGAKPDKMEKAGFVLLKSSTFNNNKGDLYLDVNSCQLALKVKDTWISIDEATKDFVIIFPDQSRVIGKVEGTSQAKPACFHSLNVKPGGTHKILANKSNMGTDENSNGLVNCLAGNGNVYTDQINFISEKEYKANCAKSSSDCRKSETSLFIKNGSGLTFHQFGKQIGSNITRADLKINEEIHRPRCQVSKAGPKPVAAPPRTQPKSEVK